MNGGTYKITSVGDAFNVNDELNITGTTMTIEAEEDGVKVDNDEVGEGDTDPIDSNGDIIVSGGTINLTGQSGFDFDGSATYTGGDITINGEKQTKIENSMPGGGGPQGDGGPQGGGQPGGFSGGH